MYKKVMYNSYFKAIFTYALEMRKKMMIKRSQQNSDKRDEISYKYITENKKR